jgi:hypothetical protein
MLPPLAVLPPLPLLPFEAVAEQAINNGPSASQSAAAPTACRPSMWSSIVVDQQQAACQARPAPPAAKNGRDAAPRPDKRIRGSPVALRISRPRRGRQSRICARRGPDRCS